MSNEYQKLKDITFEEIKELLKRRIPNEYSKILINPKESIKRCNYFYLKYKAVYIDRKGKIIRFPLYLDVKDFFIKIEEDKKKFGEKYILSDETILEKLNDNHEISPSTFNIKGILKPYDFPVDANNDELLPNQRKYIISELTYRETCDECDGIKYVTCPDPDCKGQHVYECPDCKGSRKVKCDDCNGTGYVDCEECSGKGEVRCGNCEGSGEERCSSCGGSGEDRGSFAGNMLRKSVGLKSKADNPRPCKNCGGRGYKSCRYCKLGYVNCEECRGRGEVRCPTCSGSGEVDCPRCNAYGKLTCELCYDDPDRYGKVDCPQCKTMGEMAQIVFVETDINENMVERVYHTGDYLNNIDENNILRHSNRDALLQLSLVNINDNIKEFYDEYSKLYCEKIQKELEYSRNDIPKITNEYVYYQVIPCVQLKYKHIITNQEHELTIIDFFNDGEVLIDLEHEKINKDFRNTVKKIGGFFGKIFKTKEFKLKEDKKNEIILMIYLIKADGVIEDEEKATISEYIGNLEEFTAEEKQQLLDLMNLKQMPDLTEKQTTFSSKERAMEVISKLESLAVSDGYVKDEERKFLEKVKTMLKY